jgi:hypothetical protein
LAVQAAAKLNCRDGGKGDREELGVTSADQVALHAVGDFDVVKLAAFHRRGLTE